MKKYELLIIGVVLVVFALIVGGCEESQQSADPLTILKPPPERWISKYGDTEEGRLVYGIYLVDSGGAQERMKIVRYLIDPNDPNSIKSRLADIEARLTKLEARDPNE